MRGYGPLAGIAIALWGALALSCALPEKPPVLTEVSPAVEACSRVVRVRRAAPDSLWIWTVPTRCVTARELDLFKYVVPLGCTWEIQTPPGVLQPRVGVSCPKGETVVVEP